MRPNVKAIRSKVHADILSTSYGCGSPIPFALDGCTVLDLGSYSAPFFSSFSLFLFSFLFHCSLCVRERNRYRCLCVLGLGGRQGQGHWRRHDGQSAREGFLAFLSRR